MFTNNVIGIIMGLVMFGIYAREGIYGKYVCDVWGYNTRRKTSMLEM